MRQFHYPKLLVLLLVVTNYCYAHADMGAAGLAAAAMAYAITLLVISIVALIMAFTHKKAQNKATQVLAFLAIYASAFLILVPMFIEPELILILCVVQGFITIIAAIIFVKSPQPINLGVLAGVTTVIAVLAIVGPLLHERSQKYLEAKRKQIYEQSLIKKNQQAVADNIAVLKNVNSTIENRQKSFEQLIELSRRNVYKYVLATQIERIDYSNTFLRDLRIEKPDPLNLVFSDCNFHKAQMQNCKISVGVYNNANFTEANISNGYLHGDMKHAKFIQANLAKASLEGDTDGADFSKADLSEARFKGLITNSLFTDTQLHKANFSGASIAFSKFENADLSNADLSDTIGRYASFHNSNLSHANLQKSYFFDDISFSMLNEHPDELKKLNIIMSKEELARHQKKTNEWLEKSRTQFRNSNLTGANFSGADLRYADFTGAKMDSVDLKGANLTGAIITPEQLAKCLNIDQAVGVEKDIK